MSRKMVAALLALFLALGGAVLMTGDALAAAEATTTETDDGEVEGLVTGDFNGVALAWTGEFYSDGMEDEGEYEFTVTVANLSEEESVTLTGLLLEDPGAPDELVVVEELDVQLDPDQVAEFIVTVDYELEEVDEEVKEAEFSFVVMFYVGDEDQDLYELDIHVLLTDAEPEEEAEEQGEVEGLVTDEFNGVALTWTGEIYSYGMEDEGEYEFTVTVANLSEEESVTLLRLLDADGFEVEDLSLTIGPGGDVEFTVTVNYVLVGEDGEDKEAEFNFVVEFHVGDDEDEIHELDIHVLLTDAEPDEDADDERSEVARAVHVALTGDEDIRPGPGFGAAVSARAREGGLGSIVSEAARNANGRRNGKSE